MPKWPFYCPYMNQYDEDDEDFRSPDGFQPPGFQGPDGGPPFGSGGGPGFGPPFGGPGQGPGFGPPFGGPQAQFPPGPPPSIAPQFTQAQGVGIFAVDPGAIRPCLFRFVFIRLTNGRRFWAWLTFVGRTSVAGFRWTGRRWVYFGVDIRRIDNFICF